MSACCAGLYQNGNMLAEKHELMNRGQAERLVPMIDEIIKAAQLDYSKIDFIACTHGPGAFTGLRLSLATAKTLSLSLDIPCIGISTLEAVYRSIAITDKNVLVCLETKRKDYYSQSFMMNNNGNAPAKSRKLADIEHILDKDVFTIIGDANERLGNEINLERHQLIDIKHPKCQAIAEIGERNFNNNNGDRLQNMAPLYLRDADVSFPATKK